jgi:phosphohistidine swiveling domain-containing protein
MKGQNYTKLEKEIKEIEWQYVVNRRDSLLFRSFADQCHKNFKQVSGISWNLSAILRLSSGEMFYNKKDFDKLRDIFSNGGYKLLSNFAHRLEVEIKSLYNISKNIAQENFKKADNVKLYRLLKKYSNSILRANNFLSPLVIADKLISNQILELLPTTSQKEANHWLGILVHPAKEHENSREEIEFYKLVLSYRKHDKNIKSLTNNHLKKYSWLGTRGYNLGLEWTVKSIEERIKSFLVDKDPKKQLSQLIATRKNIEVSSKNLIKKLKINKNSLLFKSIKLAQRYAFLRTWRTNTIYKSGFLIQPLYYEIADRNKLSKEDLLFLDHKELLYLAKNNKLPISKLEIKKRKEVFMTINTAEGYKIFTDSTFIQRIKNTIQPKQKIENSITGNIAYKGIVRGKAKIVFNVYDINKVCKGDILVAVMTFPNFVPAMEKAAAFVTDEGGILCHAAIIAREMKKPCIIATKNATQILKDNDEIEVDADKGIVSIVNKK